MKKLLIAGALLLSVTAGAVLIADSVSTAQWFKGGVFVQPETASGIPTAANKVVAIRQSAATVDFESVSITCTDKPDAGFTMTGVNIGDPCFVGAGSAGNGGGSALGEYSCFVSEADTVRVRHCAAGTTDDPASQEFNVVVFSDAE